MKTPKLILAAVLLLINTAICQPTIMGGGQTGENQTGNILLSRYGALIEKSEFLAPGGIISATDSELIFTPVKTFLRQHVSITEIPFSEIVAVKRVNTFGIMPNGIALQLRDGKTHKLKTLVFRRQKLYQLLLSQTEQ